MQRTNWILLKAICLVIVCLVSTVAQAEKVDVGPLLEKLRNVGPKAAGHREAIAAWQTLSKADAAQLPEILAGMDGAGELTTNWIRAAAEAVAQNELNGGGKLPQAALEAFLADTQHSPRARRVAYELIAGIDATAHQRLIPAMLNDPSLELRRDAVAVALLRAKKLVGGENKQPVIAAYREALSASRDLDQVKSAADELRKLGEKVDLPTHFGFVMNWKLAGPFDNTNMSGFDVAYEPEKGVDSSAKYQGKLGEVRWTTYTTDDEYGTVDLNKAQANHKGAITYAYAVFQSDKDQDVELRLGCINANKVWLNGKLLTANNVYHANTEIDQYVGRGRMKKGRNEILLKICQNEQDENWAQRWQFQLRVCDQYGTAILSQDRPLAETTSVDRLRR
jgi:hypothetical protein